MISERMLPLLQNNSAIRAMFEEGNRLAAIYGRDKVYDFSLGNPNAPAPREIGEAIIRLTETLPSKTLHGYMSNAGFPEVREKIAKKTGERFHEEMTGEDFVMVSGAATGLNCILKSLLNPGDEVITFAPYFLEYRSYVKNYDGVLVEVPMRKGDFALDLPLFFEAVNERTKAVLLNFPHNPTGRVCTAEELTALSEGLREAEKRIGHPVYIISDEPYRELIYTGGEVPWIPSYYDNTIVCYSYSKTYSLAGERIGWVYVPKKAEDHENLVSAITIANRILGAVNAPSLMQLVIGECIDTVPDLTVYRENRDRLYHRLTALGFEAPVPEGAFYIFLKSPVEDETVFLEKAKEERILMVPGSSFACPGYVRISYCVSPETIEGALPGFHRLAEYFFGGKKA